jgi:hypothetical protein
MMTDKPNPVKQQSRNLEIQKEGLEIQLDRIELKLRTLDLLTKRIGILAAVLGLLVTGLNIGLWIFQFKLTRGQAFEESEKTRVNLSLELTPVFDPDNPRKFWINARFANRSFKEVTVSMVGIRIWKEWSRETNVHDTPDQLLYSDNRVSDCRRIKCPVITPKSKLIRLDREIIVTPNVQDYTEAFGPYEILPSQAPNGFWLEGWAYTKEQDDGTCAIAAPATTEGAFPTICRSEFASLADCNNRGGCKAAYASARSFRFK